MELLSLKLAVSYPLDKVTTLNEISKKGKMKLTSKPGRDAEEHLGSIPTGSPKLRELGVKVFSQNKGND